LEFRFPQLLFFILITIFVIFFGGSFSYSQTSGIGNISQSGSDKSAEKDKSEDLDLPGIRELTEKSAQLTATLENIGHNISDVLDLSAAEADFKKISNALDNISVQLTMAQKKGHLDYRLNYKLQSRLDSQQKALQEIIARIDSALDRFQGWIDKWTRTEKQWGRWQKAASDSVTGEVMKQTFAGIQTTIDKAEDKLTRNIQPVIDSRKKALAIQSRIDNLTRQIRQSPSAIDENLWKGRSPPLFSSRYPDQFDSHLFYELMQGLRMAPLPETGFFKKQAWLVGLQILLAMVIAFYFRSTSKVDKQSELWTLFARHHIATGVFVSFFFLSFFYDSNPILVDLIIRTIVAVATVRLVADLFDDQGMRRLLYLLITAFILTSLLKFITFPPVFFRLYVVALALGGAFFLFHKSLLMHKDKKLTAYTWGLAGIAVLFGIVFFLDIFGYSRLARYLFFSLLQTLSLILIAWILVLFLQGCLETAIYSRMLQRFALISKNTRGIQSKATLVISAVIIAFLTGEILARWHVYGSAGEAVSEFLSFGFKMGSMNITIGLILAAGLALYGSFIVSWTIQSVLIEGVFSKRQLQRGVQLAMSKLIHYAVVLIGIIMAVSILGFDLKNLTIIGGALGVGIGFGMQTIVNNFICGLIMLFERPVKIGDTIEVEGNYGIVKRVGLRATTVETYDQAEIVVPNTDLITEQVTNWTLAERQMRLKIKVAVDYGSDVEKVREILTKCAQENPLILDDPEPMVLFMGFGESALNFELRGWTDDFDNHLKVTSEINFDIVNRFRKNNIEIPFPQRDLHLRSSESGIIKSAADSNGDGQQPLNQQNSIRQENKTGREKSNKKKSSPQQSAMTDDGVEE